VAPDDVADHDRPLSLAINGRLEHLRGSDLGFRNLTNYIARSLLETGGFRSRHTLDHEELEEGPMRRSCLNDTRPKFQDALSKPPPPVRGGCKNPEKARAPRKDITNDRHYGNRQSQSIAVRGRCPAHN
jgi:hypothetical protein